MLESFRGYFGKFKPLHAKLKQRDKAQDSFKHYYEKLKKLKKAASDSRGLQRPPQQMAKD